MKIAVQGSKNFSDYTIFLRAMRTALYSMKPGDTDVIIYSLGPLPVNNMAREFTNVSENGFRGRGMSIRMQLLTHRRAKQIMDEFDYFAYFKKPGEPDSSLIDLADELEVDANIYEYK